MNETLFLIIHIAASVIIIALLVYTTRFLVAVPKELKRIADAIETKNIIMQNQKTSNH